MTDYKNLKLIATSNPHIRGSETTRSIMLDVIIAMCPALIWAIIYFGVEALLLTAVSVIGCVVFEWTVPQAHAQAPVHRMTSPLWSPVCCWLLSAPPPPRCG